MTQEIYRYILTYYLGLWLDMKDIMVIFSQILSDPEYAGVLNETQKYAMGLHISSDK